MELLDIIRKFVGNPDKIRLSLDEMAEFLQTTPEAVKAFNDAYHAADFNKGISDEYFEINAKQAASLRCDEESDNDELKKFINKIVNEFVAQTIVYSYDGNTKKQALIDYTKSLGEITSLTPDDVKKLNLPKKNQPQCLGNYTMRDIPDTGSNVLYFLREAINTTDEEKKRFCYFRFRQGLDILDLDSLTYSIIDSNPTSMGWWLPKMAPAIDKFGFFKIPNTKIIKVPITMLQLTRQFDYVHEMTKTSLDIINKYCHEIFELDDSKKYFIKTGTSSSKKDFRNALVQGENEVKTLGEYLFYIHQQQCHMASPLCRPSIYGAGTTVEWVVRDFIDDVENNETIYHGLPLHTEYRVFVDFDTNEVLGIHNYWDPDVMLNHFAKVANENPNDIDAKHDYITYKLNADRLVDRYNKNKDLVAKKILEFLPSCVNMHGQWSIDIMQNGDDFWFIDASLAELSAFYKESVPENKRHISDENWLPNINVPALAYKDVV